MAWEDFKGWFDSGKGHEQYSKELKGLAPQAQEFGQLQWARAMQALNQAMAQMQGGSGNAYSAIYGGQMQTPQNLDHSRMDAYRQLFGAGQGAGALSAAPTDPMASAKVGGAPTMKAKTK